MKCAKMNKQDNQKWPQEVPLGKYLFKVNDNPLDRRQIERSSVGVLYVLCTFNLRPVSRGGDGVLVLLYWTLNRYLNRVLILPSFFVNFENQFV